MADSGVSLGTDSGSGTQPIGRTCDFPDPSLKLCLEFDDGALAPVVHDASPGRLDPNASGLQPIMRDSDPAVQLATGSSIALAENAALDLTHITIEAWVNPDSLQSSSIVRNDGQYVMLIDGSGRLGCSLAGTTVYSNDFGPHVPPHYWTHIACTFDGTTVRAFIDGSSAYCNNGTAIAKNGTAGTAIAPNFKGGIDGVRIYAEDLGSRMCGHAGNSNCILACNSE